MGSFCQNLLLSPDNSESGRITDRNPQDPELEAAIWDKTLHVSAQSVVEECEVQGQEWAQGTGRGPQGENQCFQQPRVAWLREVACGGQTGWKLKQELVLQS